MQTGAEEHEPRDVALFEKVTLWPLVAFMVLFGVYPAQILNFLNGAFVKLMSGLAGK